MYKLDDNSLNWDTIPQSRSEIQGMVLHTATAIQKLLETKLLTSERFGEIPEAGELVEQIDKQLEIYRQDAEALARIEAVTELLRDVSQLPHIELPPIPKKKKARKPKAQEPTNENLS